MLSKQLVNTVQQTTITVILSTPDVPGTESTKIVGYDESTHLSFDLEIPIKHLHGIVFGVVITKTFAETEFEAVPCCCLLFGLSLTWLTLNVSRRFCGSSCCAEICLSCRNDWILCLYGCCDRSCFGFTDLFACWLCLERICRSF